MAKNLKKLSSYFMSGTAEGDESFLENVFVPSNDYLDLISVPLGAPRILLGNKGSGKSAILRYFRAQLKSIEVPCLLIRPKDICVEQINDTSLGSLTRMCEVAILKVIGAKVGEGISGLVLNSQDQALLDLSKDKGLSHNDVIEKLVRFLSPLGKASIDIDFSKMTLRNNNIGQEAIKQAIESNLGKSQKSMYVLIDDTDQIVSPDEKWQLNRIWAFLLAARSIMEDCPNIKFIISLRDEVWRRLKRDNSGHRDQVDHFRNLIYKISLNNNSLKNIIYKRLESVSEKTGENKTESVYNRFFEQENVRIPTTNEQFRSWDDFIVKRSRERPRDAIQLVYKLSEFAIKSRNEKILSAHVEKVMPIYSEERVDDLKRECDLECPQIKDIVRAFANLEYNEGSFTLDPEAFSEFINGLTSRFSISLFGNTLRNDEQNSTFELWRFLHEIGFINARISDTRESKGFRHITSEDDPDLVSPARWNDMQSMTWEVHPSYRDYLIKVKLEKSFNFGRPKKKRRKR